MRPETEHNSEARHYGGNLVKSHLESTSGETVFRDGAPYFYARSILETGNRVTGKGQLQSWTAFVLEASDDARWSVTGASDTALTGCASKLLMATAGDAFQFEGESALTSTLSLTQGSAVLLVAGIPIAEMRVAGTKALDSSPLNSSPPNSSPRTCWFKKASELKYVSKPWGYEIWVNGEHPGYAFKKIFIKGPHRTSLQYHRFKQETNLLLSGRAKLHYHSEMTPLTRTEITQANLDLSKIVCTELPPMTTIDVSPPIIHRVEAVTDIVLCETSTPHLDDVVRLSDDAHRPDGRISAEHDVSKNTAAQ